MKIFARCHPDLIDILPKPVPARETLPGWLREMPSMIAASSLGGEEVRTLKHCMPFIDAMQNGVMILLPTDIHVEKDEITWDWDFPVIAEAPLNRAPIGLHLPEQAQNAPFGDGKDLFIKFLNYWALEAPSGHSLLFTHPQNRPDLPFTTLSGMVDCDQWFLGYVHFPAKLDPDFKGVLKKGTPIAQVFPIQRKSELVVDLMSSDEVTESWKLLVRLDRETGVYRKFYRRVEN